MVLISASAILDMLGMAKYALVIRITEYSFHILTKMLLDIRVI